MLAMAILNTPMQQAGFGGVLEIAIAGKPAPTGDVCCPRFCRSRLAGDGDSEYADAAGGFGCVLEIAIAGKPAPTGDVCGPRLRRSRLAGDGDFNKQMQQAGFGGVLEIAIASKPAPTGDGGVDYAGAVATMSSIEAPASALRR